MTRNTAQMGRCQWLLDVCVGNGLLTVIFYGFSDFLVGLGDIEKIKHLDFSFAIILQG